MLPWHRLKNTYTSIKTKYPKMCKSLAMATGATAFATAHNLGHAAWLTRDAQNPPLAVDQFAQNEFQKIGHTKRVPLKVQSPHVTLGPLALFNAVYISTEDCKEIEKSLLADSIENRDLLNKHKFILQHEGTHAKKKHSHQKIVTSFAIFMLAEGIENSLKKLAQVKRFQNTLIPLAIKRITLPLWLTTSLYSQHFVGNQHERQADKGVENNVEVLKAGTLFFREHAQYHPTFWEIVKTRNIKDVWNRITDFHDHPIKRAEQLDQRIAQLESKNNKTAADKK